MYDPIVRVFAVLEILQGRDQVSKSELAERSEVDLRTVQRYIVRLKDLGIPADSPEVGGVYRLRSGSRLPPLLLPESYRCSPASHPIRNIRRLVANTLRDRLSKA